MKILYVLKTNTGGGWAYKQAKWILENRNGFEFIVVLPSSTGGYAEKYKELGCRVIRADMSLPVRRPWEYFDRKKSINKIINDENPTIIHSHFVTTTWMLRFALPKNDIIRLFQVPGPLHLENEFTKIFDKLTIRKNDYLVGSCQWTCNAYKKMGVPKDRIFLCYYGSEIKPPCIEKETLRGELGLTKEDLLVGMVAFFYAPKYYLLQFSGLKGHEDFIYAMKIVREKIPKAKGIIIGSAWGSATAYEKKVRKLADRVCPNGIIFTGFRNDVTTIYHELDVAVHPSHSENLGGAGESLLLGVPTISTNVGGFTDIVKNGETGLTVKPRKPKELAEKIIWMLENREAGKDMAHHGMELCNELLQLNVTANKMADIYEYLIQK